MKKKITKFKGDEYNSKVAGFLEQRIKSFLAKTDKDVNIALSGGTTPIPVLELLSSKKLNWEKICFYLVDERCVEPSDNLSNFKNINEAFFSKISSKAFPMVMENTSFEKSVVNYTSNLNSLPLSTKGFPQFDIMLLGMGNDGHTASLFPQTLALNEMKKWVVLNEVTQLMSHRITLTYPVILSSKEIYILIKGREKSDIVEQIYVGKGNDFPISRIVEKHNNINWFIG